MMTTGPPITRPRTFAGAGAFARTISSEKIACSISVAPRPPYSFGQERPAQPALWSSACQRRRNSNPAPSSFGGSPGWLDSSQVRSSSRKASSLGLRVRSIWSLLPRWSASYRRSALLRLDAQDQGACPKPAPATHRYEPDLLVGSLELVQERCDEPGAGRAERMAERDRAAVHVDAIHVGLELAPPGSDDGGEGLVDL